MKKRKVLLPLDGSAFSRRIIPVVYDHYTPAETDLVLLRVALPMVLPPEPEASILLSAKTKGHESQAQARTLRASLVWTPEEEEAYRAKLREELRTDATELEQRGYNVTVEVLFGEPAPSIIDYVKSAAIDLIAMTTHGRTGLSRLVIGSVAEQVLRSVTIPVLLLRPAMPPAEKVLPVDELLYSLRHPGQLRMAVATDGFTTGTHAVRLAGKLASALQAGLLVLVVVSDRNPIEVNRQIVQETAELVANWNPKPEIIPLVGFPDEEVLEYVEKRPVHLLVLGAFRDRGPGPLRALGMAAHRVVQSAPMSVLVNKSVTLELKRILVAADLDEQLLIQFAGQFAQLLGAQLDVLHVVPPSVASYLSTAASQELSFDEAVAQDTQLAAVLKTWESQLAAHNFDHSHIHLRRGNVAESILEMARTGRYDLIMVGSRSGPGHFPHTIANHVVSFADQSVLVVRTRPG